jgi:glycosyltransferase involved in cell wall biosynthesis
LKVLLVGAYPPPYGGIQVHLVQLEKFLENQGHSCFIINIGKNKTLKSSNLVSPRYAFQVAYTFLKKRQHLCHLHFGGNLHTRLLLLALFSSLFFYKRCVITIHSGGLPVWGIPRNYLRRLLFYISFRFVRSVICVNTDIAEFIESLGVKSERIFIIPPFAFDANLKNDSLPQTIRSFIETKTPLLCNIGLLEREYDLDLLLRVFSRFVEKRPEAGLIMIGSGSLHAELEKGISKIGLQGKALLAGDLNHTLTLRVLASSDCYIRSSLYDGDCISLKEAIHLGIPAIVTDTGLRPKEAILFPIGDEEALLRLIVEKAFFSREVKETNHDGDTSSLAKVERVLVGLSEKNASYFI